LVEVKRTEKEGVLQHSAYKPGSCRCND